MFKKKFLKNGTDSPKASAKSKKKVRRTQLLVFLVLFILAEIVLRLLGYKPGVLNDHYYQPGEVSYLPILYADEMGITHHKTKEFFYEDQVMNEEGFFSDVPYTKRAMDSLRRAGKKVVFLVGDSYASGCCPGSYEMSFAYLLNQSEEYEVLNFGVGGTDPLHYELVVKKYLPMLEPDLIVVPVYFGNDIMPYDRTPKPFIPVCYPVDEGHWMSSEPYFNLRKPNTYFKNFEEAKDFYYTYYSLRSDESNWFERTIAHSIILTRIYLYAKIKLGEIGQGDKRYIPPKEPPFSYNHLKAIDDFCAENTTPVVFTAIESPVDISGGVNSRKQYHYVFNELKWSYPKTISLDDYDGSHIGAHYNEAGQKKYTDFLRPKIEKMLYP
ncbi:MAG: hypothetical protein AB8B56_21990 [Crocinitomicaceae bacterium]